MQREHPQALQEDTWCSDGHRGVSPSEYLAILRHNLAAICVRLDYFCSRWKQTSYPYVRAWMCVWVLACFCHSKATRCPFLSDRHAMIQHLNRYTALIDHRAAHLSSQLDVGSPLAQHHADLSTINGHGHKAGVLFPVSAPSAP